MLFHDPWGHEGQWGFWPSHLRKWCTSDSWAPRMTKQINVCGFPRNEPDTRRLIAGTLWHDPVGRVGRAAISRGAVAANPDSRPGINSSDLDVYFLVCVKFLVLWFCGILKRFRYFWLSDAVTDRKPTRHRPTRTWAGLPIQKLKKFRVKNIFPSSRKKSNNQKFWNSKKAKILIFLNPGEFRKFWFFEKISVLFGAFFHDPWGREAQWEFLPSRRRQA